MMVRESTARTIRGRRMSLRKGGEGLAQINF
jgi:hypothetical protein